MGLDRIRLIALVALMGSLLAQPAAGLCAEGGNTPDSTIKADPTREVIAIRRLGEFKLDGLLDEKFWLEAPSANNFKQTWPKEGQCASESTLVKLAYDDEALYVGIICLRLQARGHPTATDPPRPFHRSRLRRRSRSTRTMTSKPPMPLT